MENNKNKYNFIPEGFEAEFEAWKEREEFLKDLNKRRHERIEEELKDNKNKKANEFKESLKEDDAKIRDNEVIQDIIKYLTIKNLKVDKNKIAYKYSPSENKIIIKYSDDNGKAIEIEATREELKKLICGEDVGIKEKVEDNGR